MKYEEKSLDLNEAMNSNLISKYSDPGAARLAGIGSVDRLQYLKSKGAGEGIFKSESFYTEVDAAYTNALLDLFASKPERGWARRGTQAILADQKNKTQAIIDTGRRGSGERKAASARLARATGGLLSGGSASSGESSLSRGPQLGGDDVLSNGPMLGKKGEASWLK